MDRDYKTLFGEALQQQNLEMAGTLALEAFANPTEDEATLEWIAGNVFERRIEKAIHVVPQFVGRFPHSLGLPRIFMAQMLENQNSDAATDYARIYLRLVNDNNLLGKLNEMQIVRTGATRAFLILPSVYRKLGALSYCLRILKRGLTLGIEEDSRGYFEDDVVKLTADLSDPLKNKLDNQWESFFMSGTGGDALISQCKTAGFMIMARRLDLLEGQFRFQAGFHVDEKEMLQLIYKTSDGSFLLG